MAARKTFFTNRRDKREVSKKCLVLPFNECLTSFKDICRQEDVGVAFTYPNTISKTLIRNKPKSGASVGVYTIPCKEYPDTAYVKETGRNLEKRAYGHRRHIRVGNDKSAIFYHVRDY